MNDYKRRANIFQLFFSIHLGTTSSRLLFTQLFGKSIHNALLRILRYSRCCPLWRRCLSSRRRSACWYYCRVRLEHRYQVQRSQPSLGEGFSSRMVLWKWKTRGSKQPIPIPYQWRCKGLLSCFMIDDEDLLFFHFSY